MAGDSTVLLVAIVQDQDAAAVSDGLIAAGFAGPTRIASSGGFLGEHNVTLLAGLGADRLTEALRVLAQHCHTRTRYLNPLPPLVDARQLTLTYPVELAIGGATVFILEVERYERW